MATASFIEIDTTTRGDWLGVYGSLGYQYIHNPSYDLIDNPPPGVDFATAAGRYMGNYDNPSFNANHDYLMDLSGDFRLQPTWYGEGTISFDITPADATNYLLSIYWGYERAGQRNCDVVVKDQADANVLLSLPVEDRFATWVRLAFSGPVEISFSGVLPSDQPIVSAFMFDPVAIPPATRIGYLCGIGQGSGLQ